MVSNYRSRGSGFSPRIGSCKQRLISGSNGPDACGIGCQIEVHASMWAYAGSLGCEVAVRHFFLKYITAQFLHNTAQFFQVSLMVH